MKLGKDRIGAALLFALFVMYGLQSRSIELLPIQEAAALTARTLPDTLAVLGILGSLWLLIKPTAIQPPALVGLHWLRLAGFLLLMSLYGLALRPAGFLLASAGFLAGGFWLLGERRPVRLLALAIAVAVGFWLLMSMVLGVYLPPLPAVDVL
jgi:putative tricarboxylic transport membrane protein